MASHKGLMEPHVLLASSNPIRLIKNLTYILSADQIQKIEDEVNRNVLSLYTLGFSHYTFAMNISNDEWRQVISRLYYAAYNVKRAVSLRCDGAYSTESSDHSKIEFLPSTLENAEAYKLRLKNLRDDRNLADYSHSAVEEDLLHPVESARRMVTDFINDAKKFLIANGVEI
ncbi:hypothetical protein [Pseudomonas sp. PSE1(2024)]|uniref:hypothetical protein n=1 Tax=Pseudomonas sp. PSE1(2024) TaxID=3228746 RepID=UPI003D957F02